MIMKRTLLLIAVLILVFFTACQSSQKTQSVPEENLIGSPWIDSNIYGNWPSKAPALEDHFELYVNYDMYMSAKASEAKRDGLFTRSDASTESVIRELIEDTSIVSDELELLRAYIGLFSDYEKRNSEGFGPLMNYVERVLEAASLEELNQLLQEQYFLFGDIFFQAKLNNSPNDDEVYGLDVDIYLPYCSNVDSEYTEEDMEYLAEYLASLLIAVSYDESFAMDVISNMIDFEFSCIEYDQMYMADNEADVVCLSLPEVRQLCEPLYFRIIGMGYYNPDDPLSVYYTVNNAGMFAGINNLWLDENLEAIKALVIIPMVSYALDFLDMETYLFVHGLEEDQVDLEQIAYEFLTSYLQGAVDQAFLEFAFPDGIRDKIKDLTDRYIAAMRERILSEDWLSEATKQKAVEKLDNMVAVVVYPDEWLDFSGLLELVGDHDQNLLDAVLCRDDYYRDYFSSFLGKPIKRGDWVITDTKSTEANAYYMPGENSINILAGILDEALYKDDSIEALLATIGPTIGHEITHGFDTSGSTFDGTGRMVNWWTDEDRAMFEDKASVIADQLSNIEIATGFCQDGYFIIDEMVADLGGLVLSLDIARNIEDFNYDEFFRLYAYMWYDVFESEDAVIEQYQRDSHPVGYVRANYVVQQFDEFYETYPSVVEGTGMYVAPEDRVAVW